MNDTKNLDPRKPAWPDYSNRGLSYPAWMDGNSNYRFAPTKRVGIWASGVQHVFEKLVARPAPPDPYAPLHGWLEDKYKEQADLINRLEAKLHAREIHPDFEYQTTEGPRKAFDADPPGPGWEPNVHIGRDGWERFDYHEEAYWMRKKP